MKLNRVAKLNARLMESNLRLLNEFSATKKKLR